MTNQEVDNNRVPNYVVKTTELADTSQLQHMRIDVGTGTTESPVNASNPMPTDLIGGAGLDILIAQSELLADLVATMKQIRKHLEPSATQDSVQRQRVVVESLTGINSQVGAANITQINTLVGGQNPPGQGTGVVQTVWESPVEQRWRVMDAARLNAYLQRQNLTFS